ncbi:MAG TPA: hypothetical protein VJS43_08990 [Candidatus Acidoferrales bacterium]|nr:hypothetical protein [Candidatus Acidoferrales bacterium]
MSTDEKNAILARIEKLERQNRRLKQGALACVIVVASIALTGVLMAQTTHRKTTKQATKPKAAAAAPSAEPVVPEKIEAESFILKDASGRERAELAMAGTGPSLRLLNQSGTALVTISLNDGTPSGPLVLLSDPDHQSGLAMSVQQGTGSSLSLTGSQNAQVHVGVTKEGTSLELLDQDGSSTNLGNGMKISRTGKAKQTTGASITLYDKERKLLWSAP